MNVRERLQALLDGKTLEIPTPGKTLEVRLEDLETGHRFDWVLTSVCRIKPCRGTFMEAVEHKSGVKSLHTGRHFYQQDTSTGVRLYSSAQGMSPTLDEIRGQWELL